jgi:hypothetical protein
VKTAAKAKTGTDWRKIVGFTVFSGLMLLALVLANSGRAAIETPPPPSVWSDKADYAPGEQVTLSGANWAVGESVHIRVNDDAGQTWSRDVDVTAAADGTISDQFSLPTSFVAAYSVTATGASSGTATWTFTDGNVNVRADEGSNHIAVMFPVGSVQVFANANCSGSSIQSNPSQFTTAANANFTNSGVGAGTGQSTRLTAPSPLSIGSTTYTFSSWAVNANATLVSTSGTSACFLSGGNPALTLIANYNAAPTNSAPTTPGQPTASANPNNGIFTLSWTASTDPQGDSVSYRIERRVSTDPDTAFALVTGAGAVTTNSFDFPAGSPEAQGIWVYRVRASDGSLTSVFSANSAAITVDRTAPTVTAAAVKGTAPAFADVTVYTADTWTNQSVRVTYTCADTGGSSLTAGSGNQVVSYTTDTNTSSAFSGTCVDNAGHTATATSFGPVKIDKTKPTISGSAVKGDAPSFGGATAYTADTWTNKDVRVSFACADGLSGVASDSVAGEDLIANTPVGGTTVNSSGACTDAAGNSADAGSFGPVKIDKTKPTISGSASPAPNGAGWNNTNVLVSYSCSDALSGVASCGPDETLSGDGANQSSTGTAVDHAGNSDNASVSGINIDKTKPVVSVTGVSDGATYTLGSVPAPGCATTDALSGVKTEAVLNTSGGPVGSITATCGGAEDKAGNTDSASVTYTVRYNFTGFFAPVDNNDVCNVVKAGSAVPVKFSLHGYQGMNIFASGYPKVSTGTCTNSAMDNVEETVTAGGSSLNYDTASDQYIYVWKTDKTWGGKAMRFTIVFADGTTRYARFSFTK